MNDEWKKTVSERFGDYESSSLDREWQLIQGKYIRGDHIEGEVIAHCSFGVWVDVGEKFPALIETIHIVEMTAEKYRNDDYFPVGSNLQAMFRSFTTYGNQIRLEQVNVHL